MAEGGGKELAVLELYSGIGGFRYAFEASGIPYNIAAAVDVNPVVNDVYCHNFEISHLLQRNIESLTRSYIDELAPDIMTMSPPCQPFTRTGLKLASNDCRTKSFFHILEVFEALRKKPSYIMLENVVGFETSSVRSALVNLLEEFDYTYQEYILSPSQFNIPNSRPRYYILAKRSPLKFAIPTEDKVVEELPNVTDVFSKLYPCTACEQSNTQVCIVAHFLEHMPEFYFEEFRVPLEVLLQNAFTLDIIEESSTHSCCFTKAYGRYIKGTGSVIHPASAPDVFQVYEHINQSSPSECKDLFASLLLRYFTPKEIANIMGFPQSFDFPDHTTIRQRYKALGNSMNVFVTAQLLRMLVA